MQLESLASLVHSLVMAELSKTERTSKRTNESKTRPTGPENPYYKVFGLTHDGEYTLIADA